MPAVRSARALYGPTTAAVLVSFACAVIWLLNRTSGSFTLSVSGVCAHKGLLDSAADPVSPRTLLDWTARLQSMRRVAICTDVDSTPVAGQDGLLYIGHPADVSKDSPQQLSGRATYSDYLDLLASHPWLETGMELKPALAPGSSTSPMVPHMGLLKRIVDHAIQKGVANRMSFQVSVPSLHSLPSSDLDRWTAAGVMLAATIRQWPTGADPGSADPDCYMAQELPTAMAESLSRASILMPAFQCLSSAAVRHVMHAWKARQPRGQVYSFTVDSCEELAAVRRAEREQLYPVKVDRIISNRPAFLHTCR